MAFVPIELGDYVDLFLENNPGSDRCEVTSRLEATLAAARAGALCRCGAPIWVIGSAEVGHMCFTCVTERRCRRKTTSSPTRAVTTISGRRGTGHLAGDRDLLRYRHVAPEVPVLITAVALAFSQGHFDGEVPASSAAEGRVHGP